MNPKSNYIKRIMREALASRPIKLPPPQFTAEEIGELLYGLNYCLKSGTIDQDAADRLTELFFKLEKFT